MAMNASSRMCGSAILIPIVQLHSSHHGNIENNFRAWSHLPPQLAVAGFYQSPSWTSIQGSTRLPVGDAHKTILD